MALDYSTPLKIINVTEDELVAKVNAYYEALTGKTLLAAQTEAIVLRCCAYLTGIKIDGDNDAARKMLVGFSTAPILDYLAELVGVVRLVATGATCTVRFNLIDGHTGVTIPAKTRVQSTDAKVTFQTVVDMVVAPGALTADILMETLQTGEVGNEYIVGAISAILDPVSFVLSAANINVPGGGADEETDEQLRVRIRLASNQSNTAGSKGAYEFHTLSAHPSIVAAKILGPNDVEDDSIPPGDVHVYPLVRGGGDTPGPVITAVENKLNADKIRPLNDHVVVESPDNHDYSMVVALTMLDSNPNPAATLATVQQLLNDYAAANKAKLGGNVTLAKITQLSMQPGVYKPVITLPAADINVLDTEYANCTAVTVTIGGYINE